jgi:hypothetical protein
LRKTDAWTEQVVYTLDKIESALGAELFTRCFPLILTDNGHEFADISAKSRQTVH